MIIQNLNEIKKYIESGDIKAFRTKKEAISTGKNFGWNTAIKIINRFESCWIVGKEDFQPTYIAGLKHKNFRIPMLRWDTRSDGIKHCPVLQVQVFSV